MKDHQYKLLFLVEQEVDSQNKFSSYVIDPQQQLICETVTLVNCLAALENPIDEKVGEEMIDLLQLDMRLCGLHQELVEIILKQKIEVFVLLNVTGGRSFYYSILNQALEFLENKNRLYSPNNKVASRTYLPHYADRTTLELVKKRPMVVVSPQTVCSSEEKGKSEIIFAKQLIEQNFAHSVMTVKEMQRDLQSRLNMSESNLLQSFWARVQGV